MLQQMIILIIVMMTGLLASKLDIIKGEAVKKLTSLVVNITNPCFILSSVIGDEVVDKSELLLMTGISISMFGVLIIIAVFLPDILHIPKKSYGVYRAMLVFNNLGFMGAPIISGIYGSKALLLLVTFILPFNILIYTYGVVVIKDDEHNNGFRWNNILNPGVIAAVMAIFIYLLQLKIPYILSDSIQLIGNITAPMSMMIIGASFADINFKKIISDYKLMIFTVIKLVIIPVISILVLKMFVNNPMILGVCAVTMTVPVGSMVPMLATIYGGDYELGSIGVAVTTLVSVITMPVIFVIFGL